MAWMRRVTVFTPPVSKSRINSVIDGRAQIAAHGSREMPIWGTRYAVNAAEHFVDVPYDQEAFIRAQVLTLVDYLNRIQQK